MPIPSSKRPRLRMASSAACFAASGVGLWWYGDLSAEDRAKADKIAADYAAKLYHKALGELSRAETEP